MCVLTVCDLLAFFNHWKYIITVGLALDLSLVGPWPIQISFLIFIVLFLQLCRENRLTKSSVMVTAGANQVSKI
jgi:hypothetical protein